jgi:hypothetical protein
MILSTNDLKIIAFKNPFPSLNPESLSLLGILAQTDDCIGQFF